MCTTYAKSMCGNWFGMQISISRYASKDFHALTLSFMLNSTSSSINEIDKAVLITFLLKINTYRDLFWWEFKTS